MSLGALPALGTVNSVRTPFGVISPIRLPVYSVNHRLPSGPGVMLPRVFRLLALGTGN